jgi:hypothetical protein
MPYTAAENSSGGERIRKETLVGKEMLDRGAGKRKFRYHWEAAATTLEKCLMVRSLKRLELY